MNLAAIGFDYSRLAIFTTLTPAAGVALGVLALVALVAGRRAGQPTRARLTRAMLVPLLVAWAGFIAAATHLGTPANALYVATGVGRSPLSNEVAAVVAFLLVSGVTWLGGFRVRVSRARDILDQVGLALCVLVAAGMVVTSSQAYGIATVPAWDLWEAPACLATGAIVAGCALAACVLSLVGRGAAGGAEQQRAVRACLVFAALALVAKAALLVLYGGKLAGTANVAGVGALAAGSIGPGAGLAAALASKPLGLALVFASLAAGGLLCLALSARGTITYALGGALRFALPAIGCVLVFVAVWLTRLAFYALYLSPGF